MAPLRLSALGDRERTQLQETGRAVVWNHHREGGITIGALVEGIDSLGLNPNSVVIRSRGADAIIVEVQD